MKKQEHGSGKMTNKTDDEVFYDLHPIDNMDFARTVVKTLKRLPEDVYEYAIENIFFVSGASCMINLNDSRNTFGKNKLVIIAEEDKSLEDAIAHEIAHAFLIHNNYDISETDPHKHEREANNLIMKWGFNAANPYV